MKRYLIILCFSLGVNYCDAIGEKKEEKKKDRLEILVSPRNKRTRSACLPRLRKCKSKEDLNQLTPELAALRQQVDGLTRDLKSLVEKQEESSIELQRNILACKNRLKVLEKQHNQLQGYMLCISRSLTMHSQYLLKQLDNEEIFEIGMSSSHHSDPGFVPESLGSVSGEDDPSESSSNGEEDSFLAIDYDLNLESMPEPPSGVSSGMHDLAQIYTAIGSDSSDDDFFDKALIVWDEADEDAEVKELEDAWNNYDLKVSHKNNI